MCFYFHGGPDCPVLGYCLEMYENPFDLALFLFKRLLIRFWRQFINHHLSKQLSSLSCLLFKEWYLLISRFYFWFRLTMYYFFFCHFSQLSHKQEMRPKVGSSNLTAWWIIRTQSVVYLHVGFLPNIPTALHTVNTPFQHPVILFKITIWIHAWLYTRRKLNF